MLRAMRIVPKLTRRIVSVLLAAALALSPAVAVAGPLDMSAGGHAVTMDDAPPCDMPCGDCTKDASSPACASACSGLIAAMPALALPTPCVAPLRVRVALAVAAAGREREPDKPPPRQDLA